MTSWERKGRQEGIAESISQGKETPVERQLRRCLGVLPSDAAARLGGLSADEADASGEALMDFAGPVDLERRLARR